MALDLSGFNQPEQQFGGLYKAADRLEQNKREDERISREREGKQAATSKFLTDYLDPKDHLTGTNYDPQIVGGFQNVLQKAQQLAAKGAPTNDILMAIGPDVSKLNQYSVTAKTINQRIKDSVSKVKPYSGYNTEALETEAKKQAFYGSDGKLKDISAVDQDQDYVSLAAKNSPELVTTGKGLDDFIAKTPMNENSFSGTTAYGGRSKQTSFDVKSHDWMQPDRDAKGNIATDENGMARPMVVKGTPMLDDNNRPIMNTETGKPFMVMDKGYFQAVMQHNPDIADFIRGQVNKHFKDAGAEKLPVENSPQWDMMARHILGDELQTRDHSSLKTREVQKESAQAIKIDIAQHPDQLTDIAKFNAAQRGTGDYAAYNPKTGKAVKTNPIETIGHIFNNDPSFTQGPNVQLPDGRQVIDLTESFPGGGLKTGKGETDVVQSIFYDPEKRSMIVRDRSKQKDPNTKQYEISDEEIPEKNIGKYMYRVAAANGVDPDKVTDILSKMGYHGGKFGNVGDASELVGGGRAAKAAQVDAAIKGIDKDDFKTAEGVPTADGVIQKVNSRYLAGWLPGNGRYEVTVKTPDGESKTLPFKTKEELTNYIKGGSTAPAASTPAKGTSGVQWK